MKTATITEIKNGLSAIIDQVRAGESVLITDRGLVVARLEPVTSGPGQVGRLRRLERAGVIRVSEAPPPLDLLRQPAPALPAGISAARILIEERSSGR